MPTIIFHIPISSCLMSPCTHPFLIYRILSHYTTGMPIIPSFHHLSTMLRVNTLHAPPKPLISFINTSHTLPCVCSTSPSRALHAHIQYSITYFSSIFFSQPSSCDLRMHGCPKPSPKLFIRCYIQAPSSIPPCLGRHVELTIPGCSYALKIPTTPGYPMVKLSKTT